MNALSDELSAAMRSRHRRVNTTGDSRPARIEAPTSAIDAKQGSCLSGIGVATWLVIAGGARSVLLVLERSDAPGHCVDVHFGNASMPGDFDLEGVDQFAVLALQLQAPDLSVRHLPLRDRGGAGLGDLGRLEQRVRHVAC